MIFFMSLLSCTDDGSGSDYPAIYKYHSYASSYEGIFKVENNQVVAISQNIGRFTQVKTLYDTKMDSVVNQLRKDFSIREIELLSDSTMRVTSVGAGQTFSEAGKYFRENGNLVILGDNGESFVIQANADLSELTLCSYISHESGKYAIGWPFFTPNFDFCNSKSKQEILRDRISRNGIMVDTLMLYFVDMKYRK
ncbi:MAG: hypothetical protein IPM26_06430 [Saprospiraceae bacterium]|nr:hypothetical protein [Saprospiraceae bacterium]